MGFNSGFKGLRVSERCQTVFACSRMRCCVIGCWVAWVSKNRYSFMFWGWQSKYNGVLRACWWSHCKVLERRETPGTAPHPENPNPRVYARSIWAVSKIGHTCAVWTQPSSRPQHVTVHRTHRATNLMCTWRSEAKMCRPSVTTRRHYIQILCFSCFYFWYLIYLLTAIGLSPGGSTHLHTNNT